MATYVSIMYDELMTFNNPHLLYILAVTIVHPYSEVEGT